MMDDAARKIRLGVSSCLLGAEVRFDGSHKYDHFINRHLTQFFEFVPICPELGIGLGVPRQPIRLVQHGEEVRAVGVKDPDVDVSVPLRGYFYKVERSLEGVCGYIFKKGSPSCGMERVKIYHPNGMPTTQGSGLYAATLMQHLPLLPVEEEGRLSDPHLRENFITRVLVYQRWQALLRDSPTPGGLVDFHSRHKLLIMAHNQAAYRRQGKLVANAGAAPREPLFADYVADLMLTLKRRASNKSHANVLQHLMGYLKKHLDAGDKAELLETIETYRTGKFPLIVPIILLKHHFRRHPHPYVENQVYLSPHPAELMLRNMI